MEPLVISSFFLFLLFYTLCSLSKEGEQKERAREEKRKEGRKGARDGGREERNGKVNGKPENEREAREDGKYLEWPERMVL